MGNILIIAEHHKGALKKATLSSFTAAKKVAGKAGGDILVLAIGKGLDAIGNDLKAFGAKKVLLADDVSLENYQAQTYAKVCEDAVRQNGVSLVLATVTSFSKDLLPRLAAKLDAGMVSEIQDIDVEGGEILFKRPMYAGSTIATVKVAGDVRIASVRQTAFDAAPKGTPGGEVSKVAVRKDAAADKSKFVSFAETKSERPELTDAPVVVSGGRGLKSAENFKLLEQLADLFKGAIGASRAAVDAGYVPNDLQVGQTGKVVAPSLYFAVAISGAIQHMAGMKDSKVIVAINKDPDAPIFQVADYGIVGDLFKIVPELIEEIKKARQ